MMTTFEICVREERVILWWLYLLNRISPAAGEYTKNNSYIQRPTFVPKLWSLHLWEVVCPLYGEEIVLVITTSVCL